MGGGASSQGLEEVLAETFMLGRAIVAVTFPGMYRIYDFHSDKAPPIKNATPFSMFSGLVDSDEEPDEDEKQPINPEDYEHFFHVQVGTDMIYIEDVCEVNDAGWTALHACCMSFQTVEAGCAIIDEMVRRNASLDLKTVTGPGAFNSGWTPLHMACAYGVEPLVEKLVACEASINTTNSYRCTPLLEACHRGFHTVVKMLLKGDVDLQYNPSDDGSATSPFVCSPSQSALGEAARCGFPGVVQTLLDAGAPKDLTNHLGWGPLHEACFYNRSETVRILLVSGASATLRTRCGALPYHLTALSDIRDMIREMGGAGAEPDLERDRIDMIDIMRELTVGADASGGVKRRQMVVTVDPETGKPTMQEVEDVSDDEGEGVSESKGDGSESRLLTNGSANTDAKAAAEAKRSNPESPTSRSVPPGAEEKNSTPQQPQLLHSGGVLGDLPAFNTSGELPSSATKGKQYSSPPKNADRNFNSSLEAAIEGNASPSATLAASLEKGKDVEGADGRRKKNPDGSTKKKKKKRAAPEVPPDMPQEFLCALSQRPMSDPMRSMYGNHFERAVIMEWFRNQGRICPLTGAPLSESDMTEATELRARITKWMLLKSMEGGSSGGGAQSGSGTDMAAPSKNGRGAAAVPVGASGSGRGDDAGSDLYDF